MLTSFVSIYKDLKAVRKASPTLLAAICAVAALRDEGERDNFEIYITGSRHLVLSSLFEKCDFEQIRALSVGSLVNKRLPKPIE